MGMLEDYQVGNGIHMAEEEDKLNWVEDMAVGKEMPEVGMEMMMMVVDKHLNLGMLMVVDKHLN